MLCREDDTVLSPPSAFAREVLRVLSCSCFAWSAWLHFSATINITLSSAALQIPFTISRVLLFLFSFGVLVWCAYTAEQWQCRHSALTGPTGLTCSQPSDLASSLTGGSPAGLHGAANTYASARQRALTRAREFDARPAAGQSQQSSRSVQPQGPAGPSLDVHSPWCGAQPWAWPHQVLGRAAHCSSQGEPVVICFFFFGAVFAVVCIQT